mmetsp:Transcript_74873/g.242004  ORF Transcript_74873/g.242004 Transcript_74873/m.242004 type:complete len:91 (+) Transcript_74873:2520-2792(+)
MLIAGLLEKGPNFRLGSAAKGAKEIQEHRYYQGFDWRGLLGHYMKPPWVPDTRKIKDTWEPSPGGRIVDGSEKPVDVKNLEPGMEWCGVF